MFFFLIHFKTFSLLDSLVYKLNHKESRHVKQDFLSSEKLLHKLLHKLHLKSAQAY